LSGKDVIRSITDKSKEKKDKYSAKKIAGSLPAIFM
jgi:hypothetical protein